MLTWGISLMKELTLLPSVVQDALSAELTTIGVGPGAFNASDELFAEWKLQSISQLGFSKEGAEKRKALATELFANERPNIRISHIETNPKGPGNKREETDTILVQFQSRGDRTKVLTIILKNSPKSTNKKFGASIDVDGSNVIAVRAPRKCRRPWLGRSGRRTRSRKWSP